MSSVGKSWTGVLLMLAIEEGKEKGYGGQDDGYDPGRSNHVHRWQTPRRRCILKRSATDELRSEPRRASRNLAIRSAVETYTSKRRLWLLESIRTNMPRYATALEWRTMRGCSLPSDGIMPAFSMCGEMRDEFFQEVDKIRATYDENWVANQLRARLQCLTSSTKRERVATTGFPMSISPCTASTFTFIHRFAS